MEYTEQQKKTFREAFALRRKRQLLVSLPAVAAIVAVVILSEEKAGAGSVLGLPAALFLPVVLVVIVGTIIFSFRNWRCPACDRYLGKGINPRFCPKCGVPLQ